MEAKKDKTAPTETGTARHKSFCSKNKLASRPNQIAPTKNVIDEINSPIDLPFLFISKSRFIISGQTHRILNLQEVLGLPNSLPNHVLFVKRKPRQKLLLKTVVLRHRDQYLP